MNFTQQCGKNRQRCQQNTFYYAVWQLLLYFYREFPSKILSVRSSDNEASPRYFSSIKRGLLPVALKLFQTYNTKYQKFQKQLIPLRPLPECFLDVLCILDLTIMYKVVKKKLCHYVDRDKISQHDYLFSIFHSLGRRSAVRSTP